MDTNPAPQAPPWLGGEPRGTRGGRRRNGPSEAGNADGAATSLRGGGGHFLSCVTPVAPVAPVTTKNAGTQLVKQVKTAGSVISKYEQYIAILCLIDDP